MEMVSGVSLKDSSSIDKKNYSTDDGTESTCLIVRLFPWIQNGVSPNTHNDEKQVRLNKDQTKNKNSVQQTTVKETKMWRPIIEKI